MSRGPFVSAQDNVGMHQDISGKVDVWDARPPLAELTLEVNMTVDSSTPNLPRRILHYAFVENLAYWLTAAVVGIPWYFSDAAGMMAMLIAVPVTIFFATLYSLRKVPEINWRSEIWIITATFVVTCAIIDLFFWVIWRGQDPLDWYLPTTPLGTVNFVGYLEMIVICYATFLLVSKPSRVRRIQERLGFGEGFVLIAGVVLFSFTLISALLFW